MAMHSCGLAMKNFKVRQNACDEERGPSSRPQRSCLQATAEVEACSVEEDARNRAGTKIL